MSVKIDTWRGLRQHDWEEIKASCCPCSVSPEANSRSEIWPQVLSDDATCIFSKPSNVVKLGRLSQK